jgi:hypothetical protein
MVQRNAVGPARGTSVGQDWEYHDTYDEKQRMAASDPSTIPDVKRREQEVYLETEPQPYGSREPGGEF